MRRPTQPLPLPKLRDALRAEGRTQRGLAAAMGLHESNVSRLLKGERIMLTRDQIIAIEAYTGRSFGELADLASYNLTDEEAALLRTYRAASERKRQAVRLTLEAD